MSNCSSSEHVLNLFTVRFHVIIAPKEGSEGESGDTGRCCYGEQLGGFRTWPLSLAIS